MSVCALVLTGYGLNCDQETAYALELAGAKARRVHINALIGGEVRLDDFQILVFVGGFSWADDHGAGVIQAVRFKTNMGPQLLDFIQAGKLVLGICNGFQTLVNLGLLPGLNSDYQQRSVALIGNDCGNFRDDWVRLKVNPQSPCVFTRGLTEMELPIRHGEGKFYAGEPVIQAICENQQMVMQYALADGKPACGAFPANPNGSLADIAGICDPSGRVFGLMPHPEAFNHPCNHPQWPRLKELARREGRDFRQSLTLGNRIFENAVSYFTGTA